MATLSTPLVLVALALATVACGGAGDGDDVLTSAVCAPSSAGECDDTVIHTTSPTAPDDAAAGSDATADDAAAGSCLAGDADCTDESWDGTDQVRPVPLADGPSGAEPADRGATTGATGHRIEHAHLVDEDTLELTVGDNPCMLVEDVLVEESDTEVRVLVLAGQDARVDACIEPYVQFTIEVDLAAPLGERTLLDLAG